MLLRPMIPALLLLASCQFLGRTAVEVLDDQEAYGAVPGSLEPEFDAVDASKDRLEITLAEVATGLEQLTDVQFAPGASDRFVALQKGGKASVVSVTDGSKVPWFSVDVLTVSEQGLLGLAFHPDFAKNHRFYVNYTPADAKPEVTRIAEWTGDLDGTPKETAVLLEVEQPYQNHNAGQLAFGPDGMLYVGFGDGGLRNDPKGHGQRADTMLGAMLRLDVDHPSDGKPYGIPADNPAKPGWLPETWAIGLRNPWRYSFAPDGRLVIADVGQNAWEEVSIAAAGDNLGWVTREAEHCFPPDSECSAEGLVDPVYSYGRGEGQSITGGHVYTGSGIPELTGKYVFGDFVTGRIWALDLPSDRSRRAPVTALGKWPLLISTFAVDGSGNVFVGDFGAGRVLRLAPADGQG